ncbi:hypothetical protein [Leifsonia poae]|uniref:hypothetical protein n=1 Tax=Leifsonia poae TaxID=110933 RepID=UPI001CBDA698|nr:hypothetical protein [Leifsonia poae]
MNKTAAQLRNADLGYGSRHHGDSWIGYVTITETSRDRLQIASRQLEEVCENGLGVEATGLAGQLQSAASGTTWPIGRGIQTEKPSVTNACTEAGRQDQQGGAMSEHKAESTKSGMWSLPVLRKFAPPEEVQVDESGRTEGRTSCCRGTSPARSCARAAAAPVAASTPRAARCAVDHPAGEVLNSAVIGAPPAPGGIVTGRDVLSKTSIAHDR